MVTWLGATYVKAAGRLPERPSSVTVTSTVPADRVDVVAVSVVDDVTMMLVAAAPPTVTWTPAAKFAPVTVIAVPPSVVPLFGLTEVTEGIVGMGPGPGPGLLPPQPTARPAATTIAARGSLRPEQRHINHPF